MPTIDRDKVASIGSLHWGPKVSVHKTSPQTARVICGYVFEHVLLSNGHKPL